MCKSNSANQLQPSSYASVRGVGDVDYANSVGGMGHPHHAVAASAVPPPPPPPGHAVRGGGALGWFSKQISPCGKKKLRTEAVDFRSAVRPPEPPKLPQVQDPSAQWVMSVDPLSGVPVYYNPMYS
eukprot:Selendium_serpulae@DN2711_c0_g1_i1.p2